MNMKSSIAIFAASALFAVSSVGNASDPDISASTLSQGINFRECPDCPEMKVIAQGTFMMGTSDKEAPDRRAENELPQHEVTISRPFAIGIFDVTRAEYARFVEETNYEGGSECKIFNGKKLADVKGMTWDKPGFPQTGRDPVVCVSWDDAKAYIAWLNRRIPTPRKDDTKKDAPDGPYRLPTEAEWEYAARAGTSTRYYWGDEISRAQSNYGSETKWAPMIEGEDKWPFTSPGGAFPPNDWGLFDMAGNVWQWTEDCWHDNYIGAPTDGSAWITGSCEKRVVRGGAWYKIPFHERTAKRGIIAQGERRNEIGFRVARSLD